MQDENHRYIYFPYKINFFPFFQFIFIVRVYYPFLQVTHFDPFFDVYIQWF